MYYVLEVIRDCFFLQYCSLMYWMGSNEYEAFALPRL